MRGGFVQEKRLPLDHPAVEAFLITGIEVGTGHHGRRGWCYERLDQRLVLTS